MTRYRVRWTVHGAAKLLSHDGAVMESQMFRIGQRLWQLSLHTRDEDWHANDAKLQLQSVTDDTHCYPIVQWTIGVDEPKKLPQTNSSDYVCWEEFSRDELIAASRTGALTVTAVIAVPTIACGDPVADSLLALLDSGRESDVSFVVDYVKIPAHKAILAQHSKELKVLMDQCKDGVIKLENSSEEAVRKLLRLPPAVCHA